MTKQGEVYLVSDTSDFVNAHRFGREEYRRGPRSEGIRRALAGETGVEAYDNYKNEITDASLSIMFHLNNFKYHRSNTWFNAYIFLGAGGMLYKASVDALYEDEEGVENTQGGRRADVRL